MRYKFTTLKLIYMAYWKREERGTSDCDDVHARHQWKVSTQAALGGALGVRTPLSTDNSSGSLSTRVFETRTSTGSELFSLLTCPHITTATLLSIFSPLQVSSIEIWKTIQVLARKMFSSGCPPRLKNVRA